MDQRWGLVASWAYVKLQFRAEDLRGWLSKLWSLLNILCRIIIGIQKKDRNFDNHPHAQIYADKGLVKFFLWLGLVAKKMRPVLGFDLDARKDIAQRLKQRTGKEAPGLGPKPWHLKSRELAFRNRQVQVQPDKRLLETVRLTRPLVRFDGG